MVAAFRGRIGGRPCATNVVHRRVAAAAIVALAGVALACGGDAGASRRSERQPDSLPDVVFIMIDTLRADRLGCYGHAGGYTPEMDALARESTRFDRAIAPACWTLPSVASTFTGVFPSVHQVNNARNLPGGGPHSPDIVYGVPDEFETLAEVLQKAGYATAGFSANAFVVPKNGFAQGFDHFDDAFDTGEPGTKLTGKAMDWVDRQDRAAPVFLYLHYMDVHAPYNATPPVIDPMLAELDRRNPGELELVAGRRRGLPPLAREVRRKRVFGTHQRYVEFWTTCYDAGVRQMDVYLGRLFDALRARGLWDEAVVVLISDHGEALCEHDVWGHGFTLNQNEIHVPFMIRWPGKIRAAQRVEATISAMDVFPTLLDLLGLEAPAGIQAVSAIDRLRGREVAARPALSEGVKKMPQIQAVVDGKWKLLGDVRTGAWALYDLDEDPVETRDLAAAEPTRVAALRSWVDEQRRRNAALARDIQSRGSELTPEEVDRLRALGYLGGPDAVQENSGGESE